MNTIEKQEYDTYIKNVKISKSVIESVEYAAREEGIEKGIEKAKINAVLKGFDNSLTISLISNLNDLTEEEVVKILKDHGKME
jgi:predicted transposase/invertase (TIGR01784 family)